MVRKLNCKCKERKEITIDSIKKFKEITTFFEKQVQDNIFREEIPKLPYYTWSEGDRVREWFATKWYGCNVCGCLWEITYPDFPANGFVRKFNNGIYVERGF